MIKVFKTPHSLLNQQDVTVGPTEWLEITQERINQFADATGDHQWIHVDVEKAKKGPFGTPIAHGYLTLSLASKFLPEMIEVQNTSMGVNYGIDKVRFINVVKVGAYLRACGQFINIEEIKGGIQSTLRITIEIQNEKKPACIVETISRYYP